MTVWRVRLALASVSLAAVWIATVSHPAVAAKGSPTLTTTSSAGVVLGGPVAASATLAGGTNPTGTITFWLYGPDDATCGGTPVFTSTVAVSGNRVAASGSFTPATPGTYRWRADYSGDAGNTAASTPCNAPGASVVVARASPALRTASGSAGVVLGGPVTASATLTGAVNPTGTITFSLYGPDDAACAVAAVFTSTVAVSGNAVAASGSFTPAAVGTYRWRAEYSGDARNTAASAPCNAPGASVVVAKASPALTTASGSAGVVLGGPVTASATLTGGVNPTGTITFWLYGPDDATCVVAAVFTSTTGASGNPVAASGSFTPAAAGTYRWRAEYSGDAGNTAASTPCDAPGGSVVVAKASPALTTASGSAGVVLGGPVTASATLAGGVNPRGTITFSLYGPDDAACGAVPVFTSTVGVSGNGVAVSGSFTPAAAGTYRWRTEYSGDAGNTAASAPCNAPGASVTLDPASPAGIMPYDPAAHPREIVDLQVAAFALLTALRASANGRAASQRRDSEDSGQGGELVSVEVDNEDRWIDVVDGVDMMSGASPIMRGDRSWTWRWPATQRLDRVSLKLPERVAPASPLLARVINDAGYLRAIFGSPSALLLVLGVGLGILAVRDVHGQALPPQFSLAMALAVLGVFDALAGFIAVAVFTGGVVILGGLSSASAARTLLGLASLWFAAPLIAGATRPLRRAPTVTLAEHWDRLADIVIASLVGAWAVQKILQGLPGLSGLELPIADQANTAALVVLAALAVRMMIETLAAHWYPMRLSQVQPPELPGSRLGQYLAAKALALFIFLFAAVSYVGICWQLYVGAILFIFPQVLEIWEDRVPNSPRLHRVLPRGIVQIDFLLFLGAFVGSLMLSRISHGRELIRESFVLLSLPGFLLSLLELAGREGPERELHWRDQMLGTAVLVSGVLLVLGVIKI